MTPEQIETTLDQLVRRAKAADEYMGKCMASPWTPSEAREAYNAARTAHGVVPFAEPGKLRFGAEVCHGIDGWRVNLPGIGLTTRGRWSNEELGRDENYAWQSKDAALSALNAAPEPPGYTAPPAPQPASEGVRWFRSNANGSVREYPSHRLWRADGSEACITTTAPIEQCIRDGDIELDGPPPHGKPLAKPATEGRCIASDDKIADAFLKFDAGNDHTEYQALRVAGFVRWWMKQQRKAKPARRPAPRKGVKRGK